MHVVKRLNTFVVKQWLLKTKKAKKQQFTHFRNFSIQLDHVMQIAKAVIHV